MCVFVCGPLTKLVSQLSAGDLFSLVTELQCVLGNFITRYIRRHDEEGVFTFDGLPLTVCEATLGEGQQE